MNGETGRAPESPVSRPKYNSLGLEIWWKGTHLDGEWRPELAELKKQGGSTEEIARAVAAHMPDLTPSQAARIAAIIALAGSELDGRTGTA